MARIANVNISSDKRVVAGLTDIYGIGSATSRKILSQLSIPYGTLCGELTAPQLRDLNIEIAANYKVEGNLRRQVEGNVQRLKDIGCHRGRHHKRS